MRALLGAILLALAGLAAADEPVFSYVNQGKAVWVTQTWSQRGGDPANLGVYDAPFTNAECYGGTGGTMLPSAWRRDFCCRRWLWPPVCSSTGCCARRSVTSWRVCSGSG